MKNTDVKDHRLRQFALALIMALGLCLSAMGAGSDETPALARSPRCPARLVQWFRFQRARAALARERVNQYVKTRREGGLRSVFIRESTLEDVARAVERSTRWHGLLVEVKFPEKLLWRQWFTQPLTRALLLLPEESRKGKTYYLPTFMPHDLAANLIESAWLRKRGEALTTESKIALFLGVGLPAGFALGTAQFAALDKAAELGDAYNAEQDRKRIEHALDTSYLYADLKTALDRGELTRAQALEETIKRMDALRQYGPAMQEIAATGQSVSTAQLAEALLSDPTLEPLFERMGPLLDGSAAEGPGFSKLPGWRPVPTPTQLKELLWLAQARLFVYSAVDKWLARKDPTPPPRPGTPEREAYQKIMGEPLVAELVRARDAGHLSQERLEYLVLQLADWKFMFAEWNVAKVARLKALDDTGEHYSQEPLSFDAVIEQLRKRALADSH